MSVAPDTVSLEEYQEACGILNDWAKRAVNAEAALEELVTLKDVTKRTDPERYRRLKHGAWEKAREVLRENVSDEDMRPGRVYMDVNAERWRAHQKHVANGGSMEQKSWDHHVWLPVLTEEVGEVARVLCENELGNEPNTPARLREELVQVAAMACAWIAAIDREQVKFT